MLRRAAAVVAGVGVCIAGIVGCAKVPEAELAEAKKSMESANAVEADKYAESELQFAQEAFNAAMAEIEKQNSANVLSRNYERAKELLAKVSSQATMAANSATSGRARAKTEVQTAVEKLKVLIAETRNLLARTPKGKSGKADVGAIQEGVTLVESALADVEQLASKGDYASAREKVAAGITKLESLKNELGSEADSER